MKEKGIIYQFSGFRETLEIMVDELESEEDIINRRDNQRLENVRQMLKDEIENSQLAVSAPNRPLESI
jgi:hypothetical protein